MKNGAARVPLGRLLVGMADAEDGCLRKRGAGDLHRQRQAMGTKADGDGEGGHAGN